MSLTNFSPASERRLDRPTDRSADTAAGVVATAGTEVSWTDRLAYAGVAVVSICAVVWVNITHIRTVNPVDFLVYRYGASAALHGTTLYDANLQGPMMPHGGLPFTYTPFASVLLLPTTLFGPWTAYWLWSLASVAILAWVVHRALPMEWRRPRFYGLALLASASTTMVSAHLCYGQIGLFLMGLVLTDLYRRDDTRLARVLPRGVLVGVAAAVKLTPALFIVHFLVTRQWRLAAWSIVGLLSATTVGAALHPGMSWDFWTSVVFSLSDRVDLGGGLGTWGNSSVTGALAALGGPFQAATPVVLVVAAVLILTAARRAHRRGDNVDAWIIVGLGSTLLSPVSWTHHWVYLIPAILVLVARYRHLRTTWLLAAVSLVVLYLGPAPGEHLIQEHHVALMPLGLLLRESMIIVAAICITTLARQQRHDTPAHDLRQPLGEVRLTR